MNDRRLAKLVAKMRESQPNVDYGDLYQVCMHYFGEPRQRGTRHTVFRVPWPGDPRVNIQDARGCAKPYQVRQVLKAIDKLEQLRGEGE